MIVFAFPIRSNQSYFPHIFHTRHNTGDAWLQ